MPFGWEGNNIRLVPLDKERHFDNCVRWLNDPQITQWTLIGDLPITRLAEAEFFDRVLRNPSNEVVFAIETTAEAEEHIGVTGIHQIDYRHGVGVTGTFIGRAQWHNRGYGSEAVALRTRYAFEILGLRLLLSEVIAGNVASHRVLTKAGYHEYGRIPQRYWKRGAYRDAILLMITRTEWQARQQGNK